MPNRIIKESICTSDTIDELSWFEEVLFYRLIVKADDFGRYDGRVKILKGTLFPLKDITVKDIEKALVKLSAVGLVELYTVHGHPYLQLTTWSDHQNIRNTKSKYPSIEERDTQLNTLDSNCNQLKSIDSKCSRNPIQSNPNPNPNPNTNPYPSSEGVEAELVDPVDTWFDKFWEEYPKKQDKKGARKSFGKVCKTEKDFETIMNGLTVQKNTTWKGKDMQYIPMPTTWLNGNRWEDEPIQPKVQMGFNDLPF